MSNWTWDIRNFVPNGQEQKVQADYNKVNLMCYLLKDANYDVLFNGTITGNVRGLISLSNDAPSDLLNQDEKASIESIGNQILNVLDSDPALGSLLFRNLYEVEASPKIPDTIYDLYIQMNASVPKLCFPFLSLKQNAALVSASTIDGILNGMGHVTHFQLYTTAKNANGVTSELTASIEMAQKANLFDVKKSDHQCINDVCTPMPNEWCNEIDGGGCSIIS
jgi:hypothetical protein